MSTLAEFLLARIAEDETVARGCVWAAHDAPGAYKPHPELSRWIYRGAGHEVEYWQTPEMLAHRYAETYNVTCDSEGLSPAVDEPCGTHIARHDPARVLAECEAKRRIVEMFAPNAHASEAQVYIWNLVCGTLAEPYADHPDYGEEWRP